MKRIRTIFLFLLFAFSPALFAQQPDRVRELEKKVEELQQRLDRLSTGADETLRLQIEELRRQIEVLTREIENLKTAAPEKAAPSGARGQFGFGPAAAKVYGLTRGVSIGGYGEVLYQNFDEDRDDGAPSGRTDEIDLLRGVFYFGYKFSDRFLFNSEIEYEHGTTGSGSEAKGEVSMEFAYIDYLARSEIGVRAGLLVGGSGYTGNSDQGRTLDGEAFDATVSIFDAHAEWRWRALQVRGLLTRGSIDDAAEINRLNGLSGASSVGERFLGHYVEAGWDVLYGRGTASLVPFGRWEQLNTQDEVPSGFAANRANDVRVWTVGLNYRPIPQVVVKLDYQDFRNEARTGVNQWNVALGWLF